MHAQNSYFDYLRHLKDTDCGDLQDLFKAQKEGGFFHSGFSKLSNNVSGTYVLDYTKSKYVYANERMSNFVDYPVSYVLNGGLEFTLSVWHKADLKVFNEKVFPDNLKFFSALPPGTHSDYLISCNFRVRNRKGLYINVLQQSIITHSSACATPLATVGFITDMTRYAKDSRIVHTIEPFTSNMLGGSKPLLENYHFVAEKDGILSKREIEILKWVCNGLDSKQIAAKLFISYHTVNNHRRNILEKTNSKNGIDLVKYALQAGLL